MMKRDNNLRAMGRATVAIDKPLRDDINALAGSRGLTAAEYLRLKVAEDKMQTPQSSLMPVNPVSILATSVQHMDDKLGKVLSNPILQLFLSQPGSTGRESEEYLAGAIYSLLKLPGGVKRAIAQALSRDIGSQSEMKLSKATS